MANVLQACCNLDCQSTQCCEEGGECCMYPAEAFYDGLYTEEDLPNTLIINPFDLNATESVEVSRDGLIYGPYQFFEGYSQQVTILEDFGGLGPRWVLEETGVGVLDDLPCLFQSFSNGVEAGPAGITDTFADTYYFSDGPTNANNIALNRISLCVWESEEWLSYANFGPSQTDYYGRAVLKYVENIKTYYNSVAWDSLTPPEKSGFVFEITEYVSSGLIGYKENPQNKPDGTYIGATTPTIGRNVVITE
jgi:hypothetical protein